MATKHRIAYVNNNPEQVQDFINTFNQDYIIFLFEDAFQFEAWVEKENTIEAVVSSGEYDSPNGIPLCRVLKSNPVSKQTPFIFITDKITQAIRKATIKEGFAEIFEPDFKKDDFDLRVNYLINNSGRMIRNLPNENQIKTNYKTPLMKRIFDIVFSTFVLIALTPLFLLISAFVAFESKGPVFYSSKRVGTGYKVFDFYKFRSMRVGSDNLLKDIKHMNQYNVNSKLETHSKRCDYCIQNSVSCQSILYLDGDAICEKLHLKQRRESNEPSFIKIANDPRVTRVGNFIRNTSIDELPQLFNVLKGDMSIVGNRPLPLYEAEKITTDQFVLRFLAPAGITGLWQVSKRGKGGPMSETERMMLDNDYSKNCSFWTDLVIITRTIPALLQKENV